MTDKKKILIVDDHNEITELTTTMLEKRGFDVCALYEGKDAVEFVLKNRPDAIILDHILPDKTGREICHEIKNNPAISSTVVILTSGAMHLYETENKTFSPPDYELAKPYDIDDLLKIIRVITEK